MRKHPGEDYCSGQGYGYQDNKNPCGPGVSHYSRESEGLWESRLDRLHPKAQYFLDSAYTTSQYQAEPIRVKPEPFCRTAPGIVVFT